MQNFHIEAHKYIDVPFKHQGRTTRGLDCVGVPILSAWDCGYRRYKEFAYGREPDPVVLVAILEYHFGARVAHPPEVNNVILASLHLGGPAVHVGIVTTYPYGNTLGVIHAYGTIGRVVYQGLSEKMMQHVVGVYEWPERY